MVYPLNRSVALDDLAAALSLGPVQGRATLSAVARLPEARAGCLTFSRDPVLDPVDGCAYVAPEGSIGTILLPSQAPRLDFIRALAWLDAQLGFRSESRPAEIDPTARIGRNVVIAEDCFIGAEVSIEPNVVILRGPRVGAGSRIRANATIGSDGFGFERLPGGQVLRFVHLGGVQIGQDVEIGANACVARGTLNDTIIEDGAKIDNLVHIAHGVRIGRGAFVIAGAEISGGCVIGPGAWIGPNACILEKVNIGTGAMVGLGATVIRHVADGEIHAGNPAKFLRRIT
jgi:UDP-3-O-[3-hydroxymyristoyl] glucosamine N-acyltransferase